MGMMVPNRLRDFLRDELGIDLYDWQPGEIERESPQERGGCGFGSGC